MKKKMAMMLIAAAGACLYCLGYGNGHRRGKRMYVLRLRNVWREPDIGL